MSSTQPNPADRGGILAAATSIPAAGGSGKGGAWMVTLTDLVALLLTFFVMLYSMMTIEQQKWHELRQSFTGATSIVGDSPVMAPQYELDLASVDAERGIDLDYLVALLRDELPDYPALAGAQVRRDSDRVVISLPGALMFEPGVAEPVAAARDAVFAIGGTLRQLDNRIVVAGHADPTGGDPALSNWRLSLARAASVARLLRAAGYREPILVRGYGASRFAELPASLSRAERLALARRTDIMILDEIGTLP